MGRSLKVLIENMQWYGMLKVLCKSFQQNTQLDNSPSNILTRPQFTHSGHNSPSTLLHKSPQLNSPFCTSLLRPTLDSPIESDKCIYLEEGI